MLALGARLSALTVALALAPATGASAQAPPAPYDGSNPFNCQLQDVGMGTDFPDPDADPFCVKFDKTSQNVLPDAGLVDFLANEPARVAAASDKCFYYQRDHWTGSVVQGQPPELWNWIGSYFFDKAKGIGGVNVRNFRVGGEPASAGPFAPPAYAPYFEETGGGGVMVTDQVEADPACVALAKQNDVYRNDPDFGNCITPGGELRRRQVGRVWLGMSRKRVHNRLGQPGSRRRGVERWCVVGGVSLRVLFDHGAALIRTSSRGHSEHGVAPGDKRSRAGRKLDLEPGFRFGKTLAAEAPQRAGRRLFVGLRKGRVRWLAITDRNRLPSDAAVRHALRRAR